MKNIAILGCGAVSQLYYAPALHALENVGMLKVDSILDPDPDNLIKLLEHFPNSEMVLELKDFKKKNIDLAIIASPPDLHARQTIELLNMGIPVLCEKPLAANVADAEMMIRIAHDLGKILAVGLIRRHFPAVHTIKNIIDQNILGDIKEFSCHEGNIFRWAVSSKSYFDKNKGGVLMDIGVHALDLLMWWFGKPESVYYEDDSMGGMEVNCRLNMSFKDNIEGELRLSRDHNLRNNYILYGSKGWLTWNINEADNLKLGFYNSTFNLSARVTECDKINNPFILPHSVNNFQQSFTSQIVDVLNAVDGKKQLLIPPKEALEGLRIIEYCYKNRNFMKMPWLSESEYNQALKLHKESSI